jgi:hypothetical protein
MDGVSSLFLLAEKKMHACNKKTLIREISAAIGVSNGHSGTSSSVDQICMAFPTWFWDPKS